MSDSQSVKVAVLDDYANISPPYFKPLLDGKAPLSSRISIDYLPTTLQSKEPTHPDFEQQVTRLQPYQIISTMRERTSFPGTLLKSLPNLKLLLTTGSKNASIDLLTAKQRGIIVAGTKAKPGASQTHGPDATNEQTWALILGLVKNIAADDLRVKTGHDDDDDDGGWQDGLVGCLANKTLGLLGFGRLGLQAAVTGMLGFGMKVVAWSSHLTQERADESLAKRGLPAGSVKVVASKEELFKQADVLSVHYVLSERSRGIVGRDELAVMKKDAVIVNTSRGPLIDEAALLDALREGRIRGAGLDVFDIEPLPKESPWRSQNWGKNGKGRVLVSPHMGYVEKDTMNSWYEQTAENITRFVNGEEVKNIIS